MRPNPTIGGGLHVAFALPTRAAARLELLRVSGRRVLAREVGSLGVGRHTVNLAAVRSVAPGLYWVRLTQGANRQTTRVAVIE
ncbi:MAG TPA: T9SS type A sorting domain-containing protein [Candidatus Eisenbacteria bacterium]|nr:T9SS type A sorting domain-containing protein [Candidatus Eisenbacteria bacterium]